MSRVLTRGSARACLPVLALAAMSAGLLLAAPARAQSPTASVRYELAQSWIAICQAPCLVRTLGSQPALISVGASPPIGGDPPATVLTFSHESGLPITVGTAYARAFSNTTRVVVMPYATGGGGGGTAPAVTTTGALQPPTAAAGKIVQTSVGLSANASTQLVAANANRIALEIQCDGTAVVGVDRAGGTLTSATAAPLAIPAGSYPLYTMPIASLTAVTAYTGTAQTCRVTEYLR